MQLESCSKKYSTLFLETRLFPLKLTYSCDRKMYGIQGK